MWLRVIRPNQCVGDPAEVMLSVQHDDHSCGPHALATAARLVRGPAPEPERLAAMAGTTEKGTSAAALVRTARAVGLRAGIHRRRTAAWLAGVMDDPRRTAIVYDSLHDHWVVAAWHWPANPHVFAVLDSKEGVRFLRWEEDLGAYAIVVGR